MSYETAVAQMYALGHELAQTPSHKFDLTHMRVLLSALGHPENSFPTVLVAGTNGKGSTAATLASILQASGLKTGLYTSPHLIRINERIRLNGEPIGDDDFAMLHDVVDRTAERLVGEGDLPWHPSFFEMLTAMAFEYFARSRPDIVVLEVGMGGRLDATNVVEPRLSIITDISLDHQKYLGETVARLRVKSGDHPAGGAVVTLPQLPEANDVIGNAILDAGARAVNAVPYVPPVSPGSASCLSAVGVGSESGHLESLSARRHGHANPGRVAAGGPSSAAQPGAGGRGGGRNCTTRDKSPDYAGDDRARHPRDPMARSLPGGAGYGRQSRVCARCRAQSAGAWALRSTLSAAYPSRNGGKRPRDHAGVWRDAGQGDAGNYGDFVSDCRRT
jgi:hypothetical protein